MRRSWPLVVVGGVAGLFLLTVAFLFVQSRPEVIEARIVEPEKSDIVVKTVATGAIVPRAEVEIKSRVSGVLQELSVQPGALVTAGDLIAVVKVIPDSATLNNAQANVRQAKIELDASQLELDRAEQLVASQALSTAELDRARRERDLARQRYDAARDGLQIVREGATRGSGDVSTEIRSTVTGMVLAVDVELGQSVTETNTFTAGTTVAIVADMTDMVFEGNIDESEVGRIREGMPLAITVSALRDHPFEGSLEYISPKGVVVDGSVQFEIRAAVRTDAGAAADGVPSMFIRAGSSANADIVLDRREGVLAVEEAALSFEDGQPFVEVEAANGRYERRSVKVGLSDGLRIEVLEGLAEGDKIRVPQGAGAAPSSRPPGGGRGRGRG
ncbi:MAG: efflux RND transporter periplasmic adaptor subunit [Myxococcota bacterium]